MDKEEHFKIIVIALLTFLAILTTGINATCIFIISKSKVLLQRPSTYFILNLLSVHLVQGLVVFPFYAAKKAKVHSIWWNEVICDCFRFSYMITFYAAIFGVLIIAVDRIVATWWIMRYKELVTKARVIGACVFMWVYIITLCLIPFANTNKNSGKLNASFSNDTDNATISKRRPACHYVQSQVWTIMMLIINCMLPYIIIVICYQCIVHQINKMSQRSRAMTTYRTRTLSDVQADEVNMKSTKKLSQQKSNKLSVNNDLVINRDDLKKNKHITHLSMILSFAYFFFWSPSVFYFILWSVCPNSCFTKDYKESDTETYIGFGTKYLAFLDALAAPLIYCFYHEEFRKLITCNWLKKKMPKADQLLEVPRKGTESSIAIKAV